jgi:hypothetical protein
MAGVGTMGLILDTMETYLADCAGRYAEQSLKRFRSDLNVAGSFEEAEGGSLLSMSADSLKRLFVSYHCFSIQSFRDKKSILLQYLNWLKGRGYQVQKVCELLSEITYEDISPDNEFGRYYFGSFSQLALFLRAHIDRAVEEKGKDKAEFLTAAVLSALAWHGLAAVEACALQKSDVLDNDGTMLLKLPSRTVELEPEAAAWVKEFLLAKGFERLKGGNWEMVTYREGSALLRTTKADFMTPKSISNMLTRFNTCLPDAEKIFLYARIYTSGKFFRAYQKEESSKTVLPPRKAGSPVRSEEREYYAALFETCYSPETHYKLLREVRLYQEFKQYFYSAGRD